MDIRNVLTAPAFRGLMVLGAFSFSPAQSAPAPSANTLTTDCRCMPGSQCWPGIEDWSQFNASISGKLVQTVPIASECHAPNFNQAACIELQTQWNSAELHVQSSSSIMAAAAANGTCDAFGLINQTCTLGNLVSYSVNATSPADFSSAIIFSQENNIRLVIRNTGHDYLGKSTGPGALAIWTHHMQDVEFIEYQTPYYDGPAVKLGAGVMDKQAYEAADSRGLFILGGDCASVGVAGGYTQGGGHSPLSSRLGLGADQALEWEVVDGLGNVHTASRTENSDLYWALSGGGPGTYGVVSSLTVKVYQSFPITGALLNFTAEGIPEDTFYTAIGEYHKILPTWTAMGATTIGSISSEEFRLTPFAFPNASVDEAQTLIRPFTDTLVNLGIDYSINITSFSNWLEFYEDYIETTASGYVQNAQYGGNFIPLDVIENQNTALTSAIRGMVEDGVTFVGIGLNASESQVGAQWNSVHPSWRSSAVMAILHSPWPNTSSPNVTRMSELADKMTAEWVPSLESLAPGAGAYMNEADPNEPNWQSAFYGPNYAALRAIKDKYDPLHTFYAKTAVGSEYWEENDSGALCRSR